MVRSDESISFRTVRGTSDLEILFELPRLGSGVQAVKSSPAGTTSAPATCRTAIALVS